MSSSIGLLAYLVADCGSTPKRGLESGDFDGYSGAVSDCRVSIQPRAHMPGISLSQTTSEREARKVASPLGVASPGCATCVRGKMTIAVVPSLLPV